MGCSIKICTVWVYIIIPKRFPLTKTMVISFLESPKRPEQLVMPNYIFSMNIKHALFLGKEITKYILLYTLTVFHLIMYHRNMNTYVAGYICRLRTGREDIGPPTMCIFTCNLVYFRIPFTELLCGRWNMIKEVQVLCRNTSDTLCQSAGNDALLSGLKFFWGWVGYINKPMK